MRTLTHVLLYLLIVLLAACAPAAQPAAPAAPAPAPTATAVPTAAQPAPVEDPTAEPTAAPTQPPAALADYNLSVQVSESPDQLWEVEAVRGEVTAVGGEATPSGGEGSASGGEGSASGAEEQDYNRITAARKDGALRWVYEAYTAHGLGEGVPSGFTFSADSKFLYFFDRITPDGGCGVTYTANLRRMDLATGEVQPVEGFQEEGRFALSPNGRFAAEVLAGDASSVVITNLESGAQQTIPYELPFGGDIGYTDLLWSADAGWLAANLVNNFASCQARPELLDTLVVDIAGGSASLLGSPDNIAGAIEWVGPGMLLVQTGRDNPARIDVTTKQSEEHPLDRDALMAVQAESALRSFLGSLYQGRFDPAHYASAAPLFAGWEQLTARYPTMRFTGPDAMLRYACEQDAFRCYPVRQIVFTGKEPAGTAGAELYRFQVEFLDLNGAPLVVGGQSVFDFTLEMAFPDSVQIFQMPPLEE